MKGTNVAILAVKIVALTVLLMMISGIGARFLPVSDATASATPPSGSFLALVLAVMLLQTIALSYPILRSNWHGWKLAGAVFLLHFGTVTFLSQVESLVYLGARLPDGMLAGLFAMGLFTAAVFAPLTVLVLGKWRSGAAAASSPGHGLPGSAAEWSWKVAIGGLVFVALYYLFGYYIAWQNPLVREYYGGTDPGSFLAQISGIVESVPWMLPFQFARGLVWVGLAILVLRMMRGPWWQVGVAVSLLFTVPAVYLLFPNPLMPEAVRMTHLVETAPYQFLFGWFVVWLLSRLRQGRLPAPGAPTAQPGI